MGFFIGLTVEERLLMLKTVCSKYQNVEVVYHQGMLVELMKEKEIKYNVRGVRNATDYEYENGMHYYNEKLYPEIVTIYLPCSERLKNVSSTTARKEIVENKDYTDMLSNEVIEIIKK